MHTGAEGRGLTYVAPLSSRSQCPASRVASSQQQQRVLLSTTMATEYSSHYSLPRSITIASLERIIREIEVSAQIAMGEADNVVIAVLARQNVSTSAVVAAMSEMKEGQSAAEASPVDNDPVATSAEALLNAVTLLATAVKEARAAVFYYNPYVHGRSARILYLLIDLAVMSYGPLCSPEGLDGGEAMPTKGSQGTNLEYYRSEPMVAAARDAQKANKDGNWTRGIQHSNGSSVAFLISRIIAMLEEAKTSVIVYDERAAMAAAAAVKALVAGSVINADRREDREESVATTSDQRASSAPLNALSALSCSPTSPPLGGGRDNVFGSTAPPSFSTPTAETLLKCRKDSTNGDHANDYEEEEKIITEDKGRNEIAKEEEREVDESGGQKEEYGNGTSGEERVPTSVPDLPFAASSSSSLYRNRYAQESPVHVPRESQEVLMSGTTPAHSQNDLTYCGFGKEMKGNNGAASLVLPTTNAGGRGVFLDHEDNQTLSSPPPPCYDAKASMAILHRLVDVITRLNALATAEEDHIRDAVMAAMYAEYHDHRPTPNIGNNTAFTTCSNTYNNSSFVPADSFASTATTSSVNGGYAPYNNDNNRNTNSSRSDYAEEEVKPVTSRSSILTRLRSRSDNNDNGGGANDSISALSGIGTTTRSSNVIQRRPEGNFTRIVAGRQRALTTTDSRGIPARRGGAVAVGGGAAIATGSAMNSGMAGGAVTDAFLPLADIAAPNCRKLSFRGVLEDRLRHLYDHLSKLPPSEILSAAGGLMSVVRSNGPQQKAAGAGTSSFAFSSTPDLAKLSSFASVANAQNGPVAAAGFAHPSHSQLASQIHHSFVEESGGGGAGLRSLLGSSQPTDGSGGAALSGGGVIDGGGTAVLDLQSLWTRAMSRWGLYGFMGRGCINYLAWWSRQATAVLKNARIKISALPLPAVTFAKLPNVDEGNAAGLEPSPPLLSISSPHTQPSNSRTSNEVRNMATTGTPVSFMSPLSNTNNPTTAPDLGIDAPIPSVHCDVLEAFQSFVSALDMAILDRVIVNKCAIVQDLIHYLGLKGPADTRLQLDRLLDDGQREMQLFSNLATIQRVTYPAAAYALARSHRVNEAECWVQMLPRELCPPIGRVIKEYCRMLRCSQTPRDVHQVLRRIDRYCHAITTTSPTPSPSPASSSSPSSSLPSSPVGVAEPVNKQGQEGEDEVQDDMNKSQAKKRQRRYSTQQFSAAVSQSTIVGAMLLVERVVEHYLGVGTSSAVAMRDVLEAQQRQLGLSSVGGLGASPSGSRGGGVGAFGSTPPILKMGTTPPLGQQQQRFGSSVGSNGSNQNGPLGSPPAPPQQTANSIPPNLTTSTSVGTKTLPQDASFDVQRAALMSIADGLVCEITEGRIKTVADLVVNGFDHNEKNNTEGTVKNGMASSEQEGRSRPGVTVSDESSTESEEVAPEEEEEENETENDASASDKSKSNEISTKNKNTNGGAAALPSLGHTSSRPLSPDAVSPPTELSSSSRLPSRRHLLASLSPLFRNHALHVISSYCQRFATNPSHWQALEHDSRIIQLQHRSLQSSAQQQQGGGGSTSSRRFFGGGSNSQSPTMRPSSPTPPKVGLFSGFVKFLFGDDDEKKQQQQQTRASTSSTRYLGRPVDTAPTEGFTLMNTFHLNSSSAGDCQKRMEQKLAIAPSVLLYNFRYMTEGGAVECLSQFHEGGSSASFVLSHEERESLLLSSSPNRVASAAGNINAETLNRPEGLSKHEEAIRVWSMTRAGEVERRLLTPLHISKIKWEMLPDVLAMAEQWASGCAHHSHHEHHEGYLESHGIVDDQCEKRKKKHSDENIQSSRNDSDDVVVGSLVAKAIDGEDEEDGEVPSRCTRNCCLDTVTPLWVYMQQQAAKYAAEQREKQQPFADAPLASPLPLQSPARLPNVSCKATTNAFPSSVAANFPLSTTAAAIPPQQSRLTVTNTKTNSKSPFASSSNNNGPKTKERGMSSNSSASFASEVPSCMSTMLLTKEGVPFAKAGDGLMPRLWAVRCMDPSTPYAIAQAAAAAAGSASPTTSEMIDVEVTLRLREEGAMMPSGVNRAAAADEGEDGESASETDSTFGDDVGNSPKKEPKDEHTITNSSPLSPSPPNPLLATTLPMSPMSAAIVSAAAALDGGRGEEGLIPFYFGGNKINTKSTAANNGTTNNHNYNGNALFSLGTSFETIHGHPASPEAAAFMVCAAVHLSNASCCHRLASSGHALRSESLSSAFTALSLIDNTLWSLCDVVLGDNAALHLKRALHGAASADFVAGGGGAAVADSMTSFTNNNNNNDSSFGRNNNNNGAFSTTSNSVAGAVPAIGGFDAFKSFVPSVQLEDSSEAKGLHMANSLNYSSGSGIGNGAGCALRAISGGDGIVSTQAQKQMLIRKLAANAFLFKSPDTILPMNFRRAIHRRLPPMYQLQDWRNVYSTHHHGVSLSRLLSAAAEEPASILVLKVKPAAEGGSGGSGGGRSSGYDYGGGGSSSREDRAENTTTSEDEEKDESFIIGAFFSSPLKMNSRTYHGSGETFVFRFPPLVSPTDAAALIARSKQRRFPNDPSSKMSPLSPSPSDGGGAAVGTGVDHARHKLEQFRKAARGHPNHFATSANNSSRKGKKDGGGVGGGAASASAGPSSRSSAPPLPRHFEFWHWAHTNEYFVNCKQGEMLAVGGPTPAIYLDESLSRGSTSFCRTFNSPGLTSSPLWVQKQLGPMAAADGDLTKDLDVLVVELYGFGWKGGAGSI